ncbi:hypothetical protein MPRF_27070 [Mycolicibacterium parafortuitum]|uniref:GPP34 family phosphoprotein n=1 Tax=Mycolicibacterium parafortuitum TaxID=39692 RepID=A0A7I7U374_MYCPF|nr:GPP34 family phosphoprotein [Mycolicibacterium parafortuitum]BBY75808.1 hypothetical protein MPRF_27070 [Mycolicibacterium parafortuitum]
MARIAEDLFLLLLDNATAQPGLDSPRREHALAAASLLDLALQCRVRPAGPSDEAVPAGRLLVLAAPGPVDPLDAPALALLQSRPLSPRTAIKKLSTDIQKRLIAHLERTGQIRRTVQSSGLFGKAYAYPLTSRDRVGPARTAVMAALFDRTPPAAPTAAIITLLHAVDGLGALLSLNDRGWRWVHARAGEIAAGRWLDESPTGLAEVNMAVTAEAVRQGLAQLI